jgi:hypothetical protein
MLLSNSFNWDEISNTFFSFAKEFGLVEATFVLFFFLAHYVYMRSHKKHIKQMQDEIDRMSIDNKEYRTMFSKQINAAVKQQNKKLKP